MSNRSAFKGTATSIIPSRRANRPALTPAPLDTSDPKALVEQCRGFAKLGVEHVHGFVPGVAELEPLRILGREVIPAVAEM